MSEQKICPKCGKSIADDSEQQFCMACGEPLQTEDKKLDVNEKSTETNTTCVVKNKEEAEVEYTPTFSQKSIAVLYFLIIFSFVLFDLNERWNMFPFDSAEDYWKFNRLTSTLSPVLCGLLWFALIRLACNKYVRTMSIVALVLNMLGALFRYGRLSSLLYQFTNVTVPDIFTDYETWLTVYRWYLFIDGLIWIYLISIIIQNGNLSLKNKSWVGIMALIQMTQLVSPLESLWGSDMNTRLASGEFQFADVFYLNSFFKYWEIIFNFILACTGWMMMRSEAFSGKYDIEYNGTYIPAYKYIVFTIFTPALIAVSLYLWYHFR